MKNLIFLSVFLSLFVFVKAPAFTLTQSDITGGWDRKELVFDVNESSCTALGISITALDSAIDAAIGLWNSAPTSGLKLKRGGVTTSTGLSDPPTIYCTVTVSSPTVVAGEGASNIVGGRPTTGMLRLNGDSTMAPYFGGLNATYQTIVLAHEMGHVLGLGHSQKEYALMYYDISSKTNFNLSQDDVDGLTWLNPSNEPGSGVMGCGTVADVNKRPPPRTFESKRNHSVFLNWVGLFVLAYLFSKLKFRSLNRT